MAGKPGNGGYIKIDRNILNWEWYDDISTKVLFLHCLLRANWKNQTLKGCEIQRGQFVTSLSNLAKETGLTIQQTRTALEHLKSTGELTNLSTSNYRIITVNNYDLYQNVTKQATKKQQGTNKQHDKRSTTIEEYKEYIRKERKESGTAAIRPSDAKLIDQHDPDAEYYADRMG